jgi:hypothetical protein
VEQHSKTEDFTADDRATIEAFAKLLRPLRADVRRKAKQSVDALVRISDADAEEYKAPLLLSTQQFAEQQAHYLNQTREAITTLGYADELHRLGGSNSNSTECRDAITRALEIEHGFAPELSLSLIRQVVTGRAGGMLEDLDVCAPGEPRDTEFALAPLTYKRSLHSWVGPAGANKTILVIWQLANLAMQRKHVVLLEYEIDKEPISKILTELGFNREFLRPFFHTHRPRVPFSEEVLWEVLSKYPDPAALALDSMAEAIMSGGEGDEDKSGDSLKVLGPLSDFAHKGPSVIVVGHPGHSDATRERGSSAKGPAVDVRYQVAAAPQVTLDRPGKVVFTCWKDRPCRVCVGTKIWFSIGSGEGDRRLPIAQIDAPGEGGLSPFQAKVLQSLREYAEKQPDAPKMAVRKAIESAGFSENTGRRDEVLELARDQRSSVQQETAKNSVVIWYAEGSGADETEGVEL